ncbi:MAG: NTP transferase domain-containing protein [Terriglobia bacterium]|nr:NTP transferase domain-containing protein [Terriglobia bacterium]
MEKHGHQVAAVIMAGGKGSRFGTLGQVLPKCLFPVGRQTLLTRLLDQLHCAGIRQVAVGCSPENISRIVPFLDSYRKASGFTKESLQAVSCSNSRLGLLPALADVLSTIPAQRFLVCLGDIYFARAPFRLLARAAAADEVSSGCLLTGTDEMSNDGSGTGSIACNGTEVCAISYQLQSSAQDRGEKPRRWTGTFFFRGELASDLKQHLAAYHQAPFENWIQGLLDRGTRLQWMDAGSFVNVNSAADYQFLTNRQAGAVLA